MLNCMDGAYFGHSPTGWISTEIFYGRIANHFAKRVSVCLVVLLVDGHSSHIDIHTSKFCRENNILLYCLPPHSSHLTQPLDVSFFKPLKSAWGKACNSYCATNPGFQVTKHEFAQIFREAWLSSTRMSTIVNGFREAGICPFKPEVVLKSKLLPSLQFSSEKSTLEAQKSTAAQSTQLNPVTVLIHHWLQTKSLFPTSHQKPETSNLVHPRSPFWIVYLFTRVYQRVVNQQVKHPCLNIYLENNLFSICRKRRARKSRLS